MRSDCPSGQLEQIAGDNMISVKIKKLHPDAKIPFYAYDEAGAFDLYAIEETTIPSQEHKMIGTGVAMEIQPGYCFLYQDRGGTALKGITHFGGIIDSDYRGELKVILYNSTLTPYVVQKGDRIIQAMIIPIMRAQFKEVDELSQTERGEKRLNSTGQ